MYTPSMTYTPSFGREYNPMTQGDIVKFKTPVNESESTSHMLIIEDRDTRMLVVDLDFIDNPKWVLTPKSVYATDDLELAD